VGFAGHSRPEVGHGVADRQIGGRIPDLFEVIQMAVSVTRLAFRRVAEQARDFGLSFNVRDLGEVEVTAVRLDSPANAASGSHGLRSL
jgi:hypothetical protein